MNNLPPPISESAELSAERSALNSLSHWPGWDNEAVTMYQPLHMPSLRFHYVGTSCRPSGGGQAPKSPKRLQKVVNHNFRKLQGACVMGVNTRSSKLNALELVHGCERGLKSRFHKEAHAKKLARSQQGFEKGTDKRTSGLSLQAALERLLAFWSAAPGESRSS